MFLVSPPDKFRIREPRIISTKWPKKNIAGDRISARTFTSCSLQHEIAESGERRLSKRELLRISSIFKSAENDPVASLNVGGLIASVADGSGIAASIQDEENVVVRIFEASDFSLAYLLAITSTDQKNAQSRNTSAESADDLQRQRTTAC